MGDLQRVTTSVADLGAPTGSDERGVGETAMNRMNRRTIVAAVVVGGLMIGGRALAQLLPLGGEFEANSYTTGYQYSHAVAVGGAGNFVVVW